MNKQKVETRGLPSEFYVNASLLRALSLMEKAMPFSRDTMDFVIVHHDKEGLDARMQGVEQVKAYSRDSDGKWSKPLKKTKKFIPDTVEIPKHIRRLAISDRNAKVRTMDALIAYYIVGDSLLEKPHLTWEEGKTKAGDVFYQTSFCDSQSPNDHLIIITCCGKQYRLMLKGVARTTRRMQKKKKKVGKTSTNEMAQDIKVVSSSIGDAVAGESPSRSVNMTKYEGTILKAESMTSSSSTGYQMGD